MNIYGIGMLLVFLVAVVVAFAFIRGAFKANIPQSPAAVGAAIASVSFLLACMLYASWYADISLTATFGLPFNLFLICSIPVTAFTLFLGGFLASKTREDTGAMNVKILLAVGFVPHFFVSTIAFMGLPGWVNYANLALYIPTILIGRVAYSKMPNKLSQQDAASGASA